MKVRELIEQLQRMNKDYEVCFNFYNDFWNENYLYRVTKIKESNYNIEDNTNYVEFEFVEV